MSMIAKAPSTARRLTTISVLIGCALAMFANAYRVVDVGRYEPLLLERLSHMHGKATYAQVCALMKEGAAFRYDGAEHRIPQSPAVTEARRAGDCKDLAVWLASKLNDPSVIFVEGHGAHSHEHHAWLEWIGDGQLWILDLTVHFNGSVPTLASQSHNPTSSLYYVPERFVTKYGVFTSRGAISGSAPIGGCSQPVAAR